MSFAASYEGVCLGCWKAIEVGDEIERAEPNKGYVHEGCFVSDHGVAVTETGLAGTATWKGHSIYHAITGDGIRSYCGVFLPGNAQRWDDPGGLRLCFNCKDQGA
jgi:hypothetical protein